MLNHSDAPDTALLLTYISCKGADCPIHQKEDGLAVTKMQDRRAAIVERLADHVVINGLSASSLRSLAKAARTSDRMLLYYFKDKADIVAATLACVSSRLVRVMDERAVTTPRPLGQLRRELAAILLDESLWPYMRLWLELASLSAHGDMLFRTMSEQVARGFLAWGAAQLDSASGFAEKCRA